LTDLTKLETLAQATVTRATKALTFYNTLATTATVAKTQADTAKAAHTTALAAATLAITTAKAKKDAAVGACKSAGYAKAQTAIKDAKAAEEKKRTDAAAVKKAYDTKAAFSVTGGKNTLCALPAAVDGKAGARKECSKGFCCGAAQKFMKDGTKLAIETCQATPGTHTYLYYPPLPTGAAVEPTPETWRFQCISGAKQIVATATAALAAGYMLA